MHYFDQYQKRLSNLIGPQEAQQLVNNGIVLITLGGNDFVNNYYLIPYSARSREFSLPDYITYVISEYKNILAVRAFSDLYFIPIITIMIVTTKYIYFFLLKSSDTPQYYLDVKLKISAYKKKTVLKTTHCVLYLKRTYIPRKINGHESL